MTYQISIVEDWESVVKNFDVGEHELDLTLRQVINISQHEERIKDKLHEFCKRRNLSIQKGVKYFLAPDLIPKPPPPPPKPTSLNIPMSYWRQ